MASIARPVETDTIRAGFPPKPLSIEGQHLNLFGLVYALDHLVECAKSHRTPIQPNGLLHIAIGPALWPNYSGAPYPPRAANPGLIPQYPAGAGSTARANIDNAFAVANKAHSDECAMDQALSERFYQMIPSDAAKDLKEIMLGYPQPTFRQLFDQAILQYGHMNPSSRLKNKQKMTEDWDYREGVTKLFRRLKACQNYGTYCGEPLADGDLRDAALVCINKSGAYRQPYLDFKREPQTYMSVQTFFR